MLASGIVLTGGTSLMPGMVELGEDMFLRPVRTGWPAYAGPLADVVRNPRYATVMGLLVEAYAQRQRGRKLVVAGRVVQGHRAAHARLVRGQFLSQARQAPRDFASGTTGNGRTSWHLRFWRPKPSVR